MKIFNVYIGNDNTLLSDSINNDQYIEFKAGIIASYFDTKIIQTDLICLKSLITFINNNYLYIKAIIDGITSTTICNNLYYSSARLLGHYGTNLKHKWDIYRNNNIISSNNYILNTLYLSVYNDILIPINIASIEWPILIEVKLTISYYTLIESDYSVRYYKYNWTTI